MLLCHWLLYPHHAFADAVVLSETRPTEARPALDGTTTPTALDLNASKKNSAIIQQIQFSIRGIGYTRSKTFSQAMDQTPGQAYDPLILQQDLQRIRNYEVWQDVTSTTHNVAPSAVTIGIEAMSPWSIVPVFRPKSGSGIFLLKLGVRDTNFLGYNQDVSVYAGPYVTKKTSSYLLGVEWFFRQFLRRHELNVIAGRDFYADLFYRGNKSITTLETEVWGISADFFYQKSDIFQPGITFGVQQKKFSLLDGVAPSGGVPATANAYTPGLLFRAGRVNYYAFRYEGFDSIVRIYRQFKHHPSGVTGTKLNDYWGGNLQARYFWLPHKRINLAWRMQFEARSAKHVVDDVMYDALNFMRGYPAGYLRGTHGLMINNEVRVAVIENLWGLFYIAVAGFYDAAVLGRGTIFKDWGKYHHAAGGGLRVAVIPVLGTFFRADIGHSLNTKSPRLNFLTALSMEIKEFF